MLIRKTNEEYKIRIQKNECLYWESYCEHYIGQCLHLSKTNSLSTETVTTILGVKELLESILFITDIFKEDKNCSVSIPHHIYPVFVPMMTEWNQILDNQIRKRMEKLKIATNGEDKRQYTDELERFEKEKAFNEEFLVLFKKVS